MENKEIKMSDNVTEIPSKVAFWKAMAKHFAQEVERLKKQMAKSPSHADLYVYDKHFKKIHRIGDDVHDAFMVMDGEVHYYNMQNGDGGTVNDVEGYGYVILKSEYGWLEGEYGILDKRYEKEIQEYIESLDV